MMKYVFFSLSLFFALHLQAQKPGSDKDHKNKVALSAGTFKSVISRDTLYCSGKAKAIAISVEENMMTGESAKAIYLSGGADVLILVDRLSYKNVQGEQVYYYQVDFPGLKLSCDIRENDKGGNPYDQICKYDLLNSFGLDTNKVFVFTTLKGQIPPNELKGQYSKKDTVTMMRSIIAPRNTQAPIQITDENLYQDGVMFASYTQDTLRAQSGDVRHFLIYNSKGVMICSATETRMNSHEWRLLCLKTNKFESLAFNDGEDLKRILEFLIREKYL